MTEEEKPEAREESQPAEELLDIEGWLQLSDFHRLSELARDRLVLEIGSWQGRSTVGLAKYAKKVHCVDHFSGDLYTGPLPDGSGDELYRRFRHNLSRYGCLDKVVTHRGSMYDVLPVLNGLAFELVFYDADHTYEATAWALNWIINSCSVRTAVAIHDYGIGDPRYREPDRAIDEFVAKYGWRLQRTESLEMAILWDPSCSWYGLELTGCSLTPVTSDLLRKNQATGDSQARPAAATRLSSDELFNPGIDAMLNSPDVPAEHNQYPLKNQDLPE